MNLGFNERILPQKYLIIIFLLASALFVLFAWILYGQAKDNADYNKWVLQTYEIISTSREAEKLLLDLESGQRGYLLTGSREFLAPYYNAEKNLNLKLDHLHNLIANESLEKDEATLNETIKNINKSLQAQINQYNKSKKNITVGDLRASKADMDEARTVMEQFISNTYNLLQERNHFSKSEQKKYFNLLLFGAILSIGTLFVAIMILFNQMEKSRLIITELDKSRETYRLLLENLNDGIYDYDPRNGVMLFSDSYIKMLGYENGEIENNVSAINSLIHPEDYDQTWQLIDKYARREIPTYKNTFRMQHKNGGWRWILSRGIGSWDKEGNLVRILGIHTDITEQKQREEELRQLNTDMESFIYIISHDLRAPLVNIKGFTTEIEHSLKTLIPAISTLKSDNSEIKEIVDTDLPEALGFIKSAVEKMDMLTTAILDLSRIGRLEFKHDLVDTNQIIKRCIDSLAYEISNNGIEINTENLPKVIADPIALEQIFGNILDNAVKYCSPHRKGIIKITAKQLPWEIQFKIQDNGRGIAENDYRKVFDIFRRAGNAGAVRGAGMGMTYVKALLRRMKGRIWFESVLNEGSSFYFSIPNLANIVATSDMV